GGVEGRAGGGVGRSVGGSGVGSGAMAVLLTVAGGLAVTLLGVETLQRYGWGLFVGVPFCLGFAAVLLHGYHRPRSFGSCMAVASLATIVLGLLLLAVAMEGAICLLMAGPLAAGLALLGGTLGYFVQRRAEPAATPAVLLALS